MICGGGGFGDELVGSWDERAMCGIGVAMSYVGVPEYGVGVPESGVGVPVSDVGVPDTILPLKFYIRLPVGHHIVFSFLLDVGLPISVEAVQHVGRCTIAL